MWLSPALPSVEEHAGGPSWPFGVRLAPSEGAQRYRFM